MVFLKAIQLMFVVDDSVFGYSKAEGSFVVADVVSATEFTFFAKGKVGTLQGTNLTNSPK